MSRLGRYIAIGIVAENLSTAEAADTIGIKTKTLAAITRGGKCDGPTLAKIMTWLIQVEVEDVPTPERREPEAPVSGAPGARAHEAGKVPRGLKA